MRRDWVLILVALFLVIAISGCNMFQGAGKDIENMGEGMQKI